VKYHCTFVVWQKCISSLPYIVCKWNCSG